MISINITDHPSNEFLGSWNWNKNIIIFGPKGDYHYPDNRDNDIAILEAKEDGLHFYPGTTLDHYVCNGKRAKSNRKIKLGDNLKVGSWSFQITAYAFIPSVDRVSFLKSKYEELQSNNKPLIELIAKIQI